MEALRAPSQMLSEVGQIQIRNKKEKKKAKDMRYSHYGVNPIENGVFLVNSLFYIKKFSK